MEQQSENLEQMLAAARASGVKRQSFKRVPTWTELDLDGHLKRLGWGMLVYLLALVAFWAIILGELSASGQVRLASITVLIFSYIFVSLSAYFVQSKLNKAELSDRGAWQVLVGALILNPAFIGGYVSLSVFFHARDIKRRLEAKK